MLSIRRRSPSPETNTSRTRAGVRGGGPDGADKAGAEVRPHPVSAPWATAAAVMWVVLEALAGAICVVLAAYAYWRDASAPIVGSAALLVVTVAWRARSGGAARHFAVGALVAFAVFTYCALMPVGVPSGPPPGSRADKVAVVGGGAAGTSAAFALAVGGRDVTLLESDARVGGHALWWDGEIGGQRVTVDMGFIFGHDSSYKRLLALADTLGFEVLRHPLSGRFGDWDNTMGGQVPERHRAEMARFLTLLAAAPGGGVGALETSGTWLWRHGFSQSFREDVLAGPMSLLFVTKSGMWKQSITSLKKSWTSWLAPQVNETAYIKTFTVRGTSKELYKALLRTPAVARAVRTNATVVRVERVPSGRYEVETADGRTELYDRVVMATPGNVARNVVRGMSVLERAVLRQPAYDGSWTVLHTDPRLHDHAGDYSSSSYLYQTRLDATKERCELTGRMATMQGFQTTPEVLLTTNPVGNPTPRPETVLRRQWWSHVRFDLWHVLWSMFGMSRVNRAAAERSLGWWSWSGSGVTYIGEYAAGGDMGHEAAIRTGLRAACSIGIPPEPEVDVDAGVQDAYTTVVVPLCSAAGPVPSAPTTSTGPPPVVGLQLGPRRAHHKAATA